ncbi:unnamed protein product [Phaedon cochleariae]|uniref:Fas-binding factor 1 C-terminal domain-containing protein n=1 Tax=Phaedon cochleariae TaxID=80249 RepID=A0A9P0DMX9_PHACE|nr:unnamed protein product [Phaedon cochleariae]
MDFDLDDPLESDDSFFEEPKTLAKRSSISKTPEKKSLESVFGLAEKSTHENVTKTSEKKSLDSILGITGKTENKSKPSVTFEEAASSNETKTPKDDWLGDASPSSVLEKHTKKTDFLEDILSTKSKSSKPERKVSSLENILKESKAPILSKPSSSLKDVSTPDATDFGSFSTNTGRRRGRRGSSTGLEDNLGLGLFSDDYQSGDFHTKDRKVTDGSRHEESRKKSVSDTAAIPGWLGGSSTSTVKTETVKKDGSSKPYIEDGPNENEANISSADNLIENIPPKNIESTSSVAVDEFSLRPQRINMEIQNSYASLHQQESLLLVSLQFKKYEESLMEIKEQQREILGKQENQFKTLVDEYIMRQQMVENNIRLQQERINNQIQMLICSSPVIHKNEKNHDNLKIDDEVENSELTEIVRKMKQRHDEEMLMLEESFKKQLDMAEKSNSALEERLQNELKNISQMLEEKIKSMRNKYEEELSYYEERNRTIEEQYQNEIRLLKEKHTVNIEEIKHDHSTQIEYIKEMMRKESNLLGDGHMFTQRIDSGIEMLSKSTKILQEMEEKVAQNYDVLTMARENSIESKEKEIILMRNALQKSREAAENERAQLLGLVRNLEIKIAEQSANGQEDRWALQQATATLTARATAIEREAEYNKTVLEREREQLKTLKESLLAEQEKMVMRLTEEKLQLSSDKARFETSSKLTNTFEIDKMKAEAETAITVAKELTDKVNQERIHLYRQKNDLESFRRNLGDREKELDERETELDFLVQDAQRKLKDDKKILIEAKRMEKIYKERMQELQKQWLSLNDREKKLSEEKVLLSKERLALYTSIKTAKSCVLCKPGVGMSFDAFPQMNLPTDSENSKMLDANTMRLRLEAMEDDESEVSKEESRSVRINESFT